MIELKNNENNSVSVDTLGHIAKKVNFFIKPYVDRENERLRQEFIFLTKGVKKKFHIRTMMSKQINQLNSKKHKLELSLNIIENLIYIAQHEFLTPENKKEIKTLMHQLKTLNVKQLQNQQHHLQLVKERLINNTRR